MSREVTGSNESDRGVTRSDAVRARLLREGVDPAVLRRIAWVFGDWAPPPMNDDRPEWAPGR